MVTSLLHEIDHMAAVCEGFAEKDGVTVEEVEEKHEDAPKPSVSVANAAKPVAARPTAPKPKNSALVSKLSMRSLHKPLPDGAAKDMADSAKGSMVHLRKVRGSENKNYIFPDLSN